MKKDILIKLNSKNGRVEISTARIGINGENLQGNIVMEFIDEFIDGTAVLEFKRNEEKYYLVMNKENNKYTLPILSSLLTETCVIDFQLRITVGTGENVPVWKSNIFYLKVEEAINSTTTIPEEYESWIDIANEKLNEIDNLDLDVNKEGTTSTVTITKKDGTTKSVEVLDGQRGEDGKDGKDGDDYVITPNDYQEIANIVKNGLNIPTKTSQLTNDSGFINNTVNNLTNYYLSSNTYTKAEVNQLIGQLSGLQVEIVETLPTTDIKTNTLYMILKSTSETNNIYDEYLYINNNWELIGSTEIDLSGYQTKIDSSHKLSSDLVDDTNKTNLFVTSTEKTTWNNKSDFSGSYNDLTNIPSNIVTNTNYATSTTAGVLKPSAGLLVNTSNGNAYCEERTYQQYQDDGSTAFISKGTLENVLTGKGYGTGTITGITMNGTSKGTSGVVDLGTVITSHQDISGKLDVSKVKSSTSTTSGDVYDVTYINTMLGDIETILTTITTGGGVA